MKMSFRKFPEGDTIAFFQNGTYECNPGCVMSYQHIGQHGEASRDLQAELESATPAEIAILKAELESIGYDVQVVKVV
jgi:hypothetical protein